MANTSNNKHRNNEHQNQHDQKYIAPRPNRRIRPMRVFNFLKNTHVFLRILFFIRVYSNLDISFLYVLHSYQSANSNRFRTNIHRYRRTDKRPDRIGLAIVTIR